MVRQSSFIILSSLLTCGFWWNPINESCPVSQTVLVPHPSWQVGETSEGRPVGELPPEFWPMFWSVGQFPSRSGPTEHTRLKGEPENLLGRDREPNGWNSVLSLKRQTKKLRKWYFENQLVNLVKLNGIRNCFQLLRILKYRHASHRFVSSFKCGHIFIFSRELWG